MQKLQISRYCATIATTRVYRANLGGRGWTRKESAAHNGRRVPVKIHSVAAEVPAAKDDVSAKFNELAEKWIRETLRQSFVTQIVLHPSYQQIIGMGPVVLPLIFPRLVDQPNH